MEPTRIFDFPYYQKDNHSLKKSIGYFHEGAWKYFSTDELIDKINKGSRGLLKLGLKPGDKIVLAGYKNRPEWMMMDFAALQVGIIVVPVYPTISSSEYEYIFKDADIAASFVGGQDLYEKVDKASKVLGNYLDTYTFDRQDGCKYWEDIFTEENQDKVEEISSTIKAKDLATIIYTSGTTGAPKGVMLSHDNIVSNIKAVKEILPVTKGKICLSFLPQCHIFERTASISYIYNSVEIVFTGTDNLGGDEGDLKKIKPHFFTTVPRLLEKVYEKIYNKGLDLSGAKKKLFFWALDLTDDYSYDMKNTGLSNVKWKVADKLIFSKWREALGGRVEGILTGAAPCPAKIIRIFSAAGIPIREGYGLTETSPGIAIGRYESDGSMIGTVGPTLKGVEVLIDDSDGIYAEGEGEILAKGPNIMMGYYNKPDKTAEVTKVVNGEPWFCTGDIGKIIQKHGKEFIKITDRKKELLKTSGGKYVAPAPIESKFKENFLIEQMMVVGEGRKFVSALIVPSEEALKEWCSCNEVEWSNLVNISENDKVNTLYNNIVKETNPHFSKIEQIKKISLVPDPWEPTKKDGTDAELTPTLKLKRRVIEKKYKDAIEKLYS